MWANRQFPQPDFHWKDTQPYGLRERTGARIFRSATFVVSTVSSFVTKGSQALYHVSCSPSKIPYVGFSPVRLKTGIQPHPSITWKGFKCEAHMHHLHGILYAVKAAVSDSYSPIRGIFPSCAESSYNGYPVQRPLARLRVIVSPWVIAYYGLIRDSRPSHCLIFFVQWVFALRLRMGWERELPHFNLCICSTVPPLVPLRTEQLRISVTSLSVLAFDTFAQARHPLIYASRFLRSRVTRLISSLTLRPGRLLALHRQGLLLSSFRLLSHLRETSNITMWANRQFPQPDFHWQDTQPYGLRAKDTKENSINRERTRIKNVQRM